MSEAILDAGLLIHLAELEYRFAVCGKDCEHIRKC
jgi:hypothetical protein